MQKKLWFIIAFFSFHTYLNAVWVHKRVLSNGLTVLIRPTQTLQKVSTQLWVNVGSKHEENKHGLAHWLEHMIFKGTESMSEEDMMLTTKKLSGTTNAATYYDWTHFYIDLPVQHWTEALPMLAEGFDKCTFKQDLMDAEVQVVIQELKMYKDQPYRDLTYHTISSLFPDHPYHYPVIGYKHDLRMLNRTDLIDFYKKHYVPGNAVLVIVGNVNLEEAFSAVETHFGSLAAGKKPTGISCISKEDIVKHKTVLYRNVQHPKVSLSYKIPGSKYNDPFIQDLMALVLTNLPNARLVKLLIHENHLVHTLSCDTFNLFDNDSFTIRFEPKKYSDIRKICSYIQQEITHIAHHGISQDELTAAMKLFESSYYSFLEQNHSQAFAIAVHYLAREDENFIFERYIIKDPELVQEKIKNFAREYLRPHVMHKGYVLPIPQEEQNTWNRLQEESNKEDAAILAEKQRQTELEAPRYTPTIHPKKPLDALIPEPTILKLENGLTVYYYHNPAIPKIKLILKLKVNDIYESKEKKGLFKIHAALLKEGTKHYTQEELAIKLSSHGIELDVAPGFIAMEMLHNEFLTAFSLLEEIVIRPKFKQASLTKVKEYICSAQQRSQESPQKTVQKLIYKYFYDEHPYAYGSLGNEKTIKNIHLADIMKLHKHSISPDGAALILVGNLENYDIPELMQKTIAYWQGPKIPDLTWPDIIPNKEKPTEHQTKNEQIIVALAKLSIARSHEDFYKLLLFDMVFNEKLFTLRSLSGAFYAISGTLLHQSGEQQGLVYITTNVSQTRVHEAETLIRQALPRFIDEFNEHDLESAKLKLFNRPADLYATNESMADLFSYLHSQNLPLDYYAQRNKLLETITVDEVKEAVTKVLDVEKLVTFKVGKINK